MNISPAAKKVIKKLEEAGFEAYCVGGCVRDSLMGRSPDDFDVTTSALPEQTCAVFEGWQVIETGLKHGTVTVRTDGENIEVTTYRLDGEYLDGRRPSEVFFTRSLEDDLARRDFTVNAMAYSPERGLVDIFGGTEDIKRRVIRCVGEPNKRFEEDGLRILRALRFASTLDFTLDGATAESIHKNKALLANISAERILVELKKLVMGKAAERVLSEFSDVLCEIIPEFSPSVGFEQHNPYHIYDVYTHTLRALGASKGDVYVKLALLFHDIGKPESFTEDGRGGHFYGHHEISARLARQALTRLKADGKTLKTVVRLVDDHDRMIFDTEKSVRRTLARLGEEDTRRLIEIKRGDNSALSPHIVEERLAELDRIELLVNECVAKQNCLSLKTLALRGGDVISLGVPAGAEVGEILNGLLARVIDGELPNERSALLQAAKQMHIEKHSQ